MFILILVYYITIQLCQKKGVKFGVGLLAQLNFSDFFSISDLCATIKEFHNLVRFLVITLCKFDSILYINCCVIKKIFHASLFRIIYDGIKIISKYVAV